MQEKLFLSFIYDVLKQKVDSPSIVKLFAGDSSKAFSTVCSALDSFNKQPSRDDLVESTLRAFADYVQTSLVSIFDNVSLQFFLLTDISGKQEKLSQKIDSQLMSHRVLKKYMLFHSYEDVQKVFSSIIARGYGYDRPFIIQSAREFDFNRKQAIRKKFSDRFVQFQVKKDLLGGMRVYEDGQIADLSWLGKIHALKTLT